MNECKQLPFAMALRRELVLTETLEWRAAAPRSVRQRTLGAYVEMWNGAIVGVR